MSDHQTIPFPGEEKTGGQNIRPLHGIRVLELGSLVAAPMAARILADFGAEVIKVEQPGRGDELRTWGTMIPTQMGQISAWWLSQARNKRLITLNLREKAGQDLVLKLVEQCDLVIENFRPGRLEGWNLGYERLREVNPRVILVRISGFGQTGPYSERAGYGNISEAMGGIRYVTGFPDRPPVRMGVSLGDELAAMQAAMGALLALQARERTGLGQVVDVAITEAVFALTESMLAEYMHANVVRERSGNDLLHAAPSNTYQTSDDGWLAIGGNGDNVFRRLARAIGQAHLAEDKRFQDNQGRIHHRQELDEIISAWTRTQTLVEAQAILDEAGVPAGPVMSIADIAANSHYQARGMISQVSDMRMPGHIAFMPGIVPHLSETPGAISHSGGELGVDNACIYRDLLGLDETELNRFIGEGVI
ncbi:succinyl-CoA--D-citramalate CoA-transferase [Ktedonobacter sp. SOSP1-52]|uniref:CaiB/BaiF CoA transferase family protein n=1 Tax=Ktedonobacter sp. SOSP1-52 TaxID=2778366 RepID=UPI001915A6E1|nr:CoA transferase [Ktedonobacter sp. SOSP1-52]GHO71510.1 succinyl-CoA--D-citramalate CoA-transferase [Ktedonobacter sp. SOSP1-52]